MTNLSRHENDFLVRKAFLDEKMTAGIFWAAKYPPNDSGAIADARKLSWSLALRKDILGALALMTEVHTKALNLAEEMLWDEPDNRNWQKWRNQSERALWFYNALRQTLLFFGSL